MACGAGDRARPFVPFERTHLDGSGGEAMEVLAEAFELDFDSDWASAHPILHPTRIAHLERQPPPVEEQPLHLRSRERS